MAALSDSQIAFVNDNPFPGVVTTLRADGSPHSTVVWVDAADGSIRFNTARGRLKDRNIERDPRVSVIVVDPADQYRWVAVSGTVTMTEDGADAHIDALAKKYLGADSYPFRDPAETRVTAIVVADKVDSSGFGS